MLSNTDNQGFIRGLLRMVSGSNEPKQMRIRQITETYSVSAQISEADVVAIKEAGFKTLMCNRPDGESAGQPTSDAMKKLAKEHGLKFFYIPQGHRGISNNTLIDFKKAVVAKNGPVLAYCRSGNRCTMLWNAHQG